MGNRSVTRLGLCEGREEESLAKSSWEVRLKSLHGGTFVFVFPFLLFIFVFLLQGERGSWESGLRLIFPMVGSLLPALPSLPPAVSFVPLSLSP